MNALILAGGQPDAVSRLQGDRPNKAFCEVHGMTLVERTLRAVRDAASVERIVVVAPPRTHASTALTLADETRPDGRRIDESLRIGLAGFDPDVPVLVGASDLPVLTPLAVESFIADALAADPDIAYAIVEKRVHLARFPKVPHTWARMREGVYCGGAFVTIKPRALDALDVFLARLAEGRKNPLALARVFGIDVLLRFAFAQLSIRAAETRAHALLGRPVRAIPCAYPEIAVNVDRASDLALAQQLVGKE